MVRTDQMWRYPRTVFLGHFHRSSDDDLTWELLTAVRRSTAQGWDFELDCGCVLQSCWDDTMIEVQVDWHPDVLNWGREPIDA